MSLQRMIVIPSDTFDRWKKIVMEDKKLSDLDREMRNILFNHKLNTVKKWHLYRQNLLKYLNVKRPVKHERYIKNLITTDTQTDSAKYRNTEAQTLPPPEQKSIATQLSRKAGAKLVKSFQEIPSVEEVFGNSNRFSSLEEEHFNESDENDAVEIDVDDVVRQQALEGQPYSVRIAKERKSMNPTEYRIFELSNGEQVNVPVEKQIITRSVLKRNNISSDPTQTTLLFPPRKKLKQKSSTTSTPVKSQQKGKGNSIQWKMYK